MALLVVRCPKCGREAEDGAVICGGCDFILDSSFLGDDIMDAEADRRVKTKELSTAGPTSASAKGKKGKRKKAAAAAARAPLEGDGSWAADALILGDLDDDDVASFQANDTGLAKREVTMARMYVGGSIQALLMPDAIPEVAPDVALDSVRITPFERHVLELVNGKRPVARIKVKARLKDEDFQTALALLADKGFLRLKGRAKQVPKKRAEPPVQTPRVEHTLIAETPSAHEPEDAQGEALGFDGLRTGPAGDPSGEVGSTMLQPAPRFDEGDDDDAPGSEADRSHADRGPLSFADSIISEEGVFASAEGGAARDVERAPPAPARPAPRETRARRRPPLPGEIPPPVEEPEEEAPPGDIHDEPTSDTYLPETASSFVSLPPPLPFDASREEPRSSGVEVEAVGFEELETAPPAPVSVAAADISLMEIDTLPLRAQEKPSPPALEAPPQPPASPPSSPASPPPAAPPPLPGAATPPPLPGAARSAPLRAPMARASSPAARPAAPPPPPLHDDKQAVEAPDSSSGEGVEPAVSFEMQRKSARIFEQAERDIAEGNVSSAIMNVKLALIYNPGEKRYRQFLQDWESMAVEQPKASKETQLLDDAQAAEQKGDYDKALTLLQKALARAPRNAGLHNRVGVLLATRLKRYKEAAEHVLTAIELAPGNLAYKNNLGKILAKEESAIHKMPMKRGKRTQKDDDRVVVKKLRPKLF